MIVEIVAVGTELLLGEIVNSNAAVIGARLAEDGFDVHHQVTVGDNLARLADALRTSAARADAVIVTGGIGPTQDDLTRDALCVAGGRTMTRDTAYADVIRDRITRALGTVSNTTLRMADHPDGSDTLPNRNGVALGIAMEHEGTWIYALPGVPSEMAVMLEEQVLPRLRAAAGAPAVLRSRVLRTWGWGESRVADALDDLYTSANPSIAFLIDGVEVRVRISAKAADATAADRMLDRVEDDVRRRLGPTVFGRDHDTVEVLVARHLRAHGWRLGTIEALTVGTVASAFCTAGGPGPSFAGALIVPGGDGTGAVPDGAPDALLDRAADVLDAEVLLAVGDAVPAGDGADGADDADTGRAPHTVMVGVQTPEQRRMREIRLLGDTPRIREFARGTALHLIRLAITGQWWDG